MIESSSKAFFVVILFQRMECITRAGANFQDEPPPWIFGKMLQGARRLLKGLESSRGETGMNVREPG